MTKLSKVLIGIVALLVVTVGALAWRVFAPKPTVIYAPSPSVSDLPVSPKQDTSAVRQGLKALEVARETRRAQLIQRDRDAVAVYSKMDPGSAEAKKLKTQIDSMRAEWETEKHAFEQWRQAYTDSVNAANKQGREPNVEPPPLPGPTPQLSTSTPGDATKSKNQDVQTFAAIATAGVCIIQPPMCAVAMMLGPILGDLLGDEETVKQILNIAGHAAGLKQEDINRIGDIVKKNPKTRDVINVVLDSAVKRAGMPPAVHDAIKTYVNDVDEMENRLNGAAASFRTRKESACNDIRSQVTGAGGQLKAVYQEGLRQLVSSNPTLSEMYRACHLDNLPTSRAVGDTGR